MGEAAATGCDTVDDHASRGPVAMAILNTVTMVASPRPRVGKTLLARLLLEFHVGEGRHVEGFDLGGGGEAAFARFLPSHVRAATVADVRAQMALFDRLIEPDGVHKVLDIGHACFARFFAVARDIDFVAEAWRRAIAASVLYIMTPDEEAANAFTGLSALLPPTALTPVHNEMLGALLHRNKYGLFGRGTMIMHVPALPPGLGRWIDHPQFSFAAIPSAPTAARDEIARWLRRVHLEFREFHLRQLLSEVQSAVRRPVPDRGHQA